MGINVQSAGIVKHVQPTQPITWAGMSSNGWWSVVFGLAILFGTSGFVSPTEAQLNRFSQLDELGADASPEESVIGPGQFKPERSHVIFHGQVTNLDPDQTIRAGSRLLLEITATPIGGFHVYAHAATQSNDAAANPTMIALMRNNWVAYGPSAPRPKSKTEYGATLQYHDEPVTWAYEIHVPDGFAKPKFELMGAIAFQTCDQQGCDMPTSVGFVTEVFIGATPQSSFALSFEQLEQSYNEIAIAATKNPTLPLTAPNAGTWEGKSLAFVLPLAFLAGLILNVMPCVLPVIGLKVMSFVEQAGEDPRRVFMLNLVFSLGMLAVFILLATLAVFFGFGWGDLYQSVAFKAVMISVVFVFGLSFFGVWEIPIPGFVGSAAGTELAEKEGLGGAFFKGILTTLLATPCSGPMLVPAVIWAIAQPPVVTYLVFISLGLGMALPYLLIGAMPRLATFLPRPGKWMETFKQVMGFVLMGTAVFFIGGAGTRYMIPILSLMCFLALGCWWVGRTSLAAEVNDKVKAWSIGGAIVAVGLVFSFWFMIPAYELEWRQFTRSTLDKRLAENKIVFVDFTADW